MTARRRARHWPLYALGVGVLSAMLLGNLLLSAGRHRAEASELEQRRARAAAGPVVDVAAAAPAASVRTITLTGETRAFRQTTLFAKVSGYLKMVKVDKGDLVREGDVLGVIEAPEVEQQVASKRADLAIKKITDARYRALAQNGIISQQEQQQAQADVQIASADLLALNALRGYEVIRAPFSGVITARYADPGALLQAATSSQSALPLVDVAEVSRLRVFVHLGQNEALSVRVGDPVTVFTDQSPGQKIQATVTRFTKELDPQTRTMLTEIDVDNGTAGWFPGIFVRVSLTVRVPQTLAIPAEALILQNGSSLVARVDRGRARFVPVEIGESDGKLVRVRSGLNAGDQVILHPSDDVVNDGPVRVRSSRS